MQFATTRKLAHYWATDYDWRKVEKRINAVPNFVTEIVSPRIFRLGARLSFR